VFLLVIQDSLSRSSCTGIVQDVLKAVISISEWMPCISFRLFTNIVSDGLCRRRHGIRNKRCYVVASPCVLSIHGEKGPVETSRELRFSRVHAGKSERYSREYDRKSRSDRRRASPPIARYTSCTWRMRFCSKDGMFATLN
jgi:hypothetical protein